MVSTPVIHVITPERRNVNLAQLADPWRTVYPHSKGHFEGERVGTLFPLLRCLRIQELIMDGIANHFRPKMHYIAYASSKLFRGGRGKGHKPPVNH